MFFSIHYTVTSVIVNMLLLLSIIKPVVAELVKEKQHSTISSQNLKLTEWIIMPKMYNDLVNISFMACTSSDIQFLEQHDNMYLIKGLESDIKSIFDTQAFNIYKNTMIKSYGSDLVSQLERMSLNDAIKYIEDNMSYFTSSEVDEALKWVSKQSDKLKSNQTQKGSKDKAKEYDTDTLSSYNDAPTTKTQVQAISLTVTDLVKYYQDNESNSKHKVKVTVIYPDDVEACLYQPAPQPESQPAHQSSTQSDSVTVAKSKTETSSDTWSASPTPNSSGTGPCIGLKSIMLSFFITLLSIY